MTVRLTKTLYTPLYPSFLTLPFQDGAVIVDSKLLGKLIMLHTSANVKWKYQAKAFLTSLVPVQLDLTVMGLCDIVIRNSSSKAHLSMDSKMPRTWS